jgi:hypothetical protein
MNTQHQKWQELASTSHYQTAVEVRQELYAGNMQEAIMGVTELIEALYRSDKRAARGQLVRLMKHILKWHLGPEYRTTACRVSISDARQEIEYLLEDTPIEMREYLQSKWQWALEMARGNVVIETNMDSPVTQLSWQEVFDDEYPQDSVHAESRLSIV